MKYNLRPILHNRIVLHFITFLALLDLVYFLNINDITSFATLLLVGILTSFFSKNMIVILVIAMSVVHIIKYGTAAYVSEGMEGKISQDEDEGDTDKDDKDGKKDKDGKDGKTVDYSPKTEKDKIEYANLKNDYQDFQGIQTEILENMQKIDPLLDRAESFINRFEAYKKRK